jgi:autotransporter-associated beta strand protein
MKLPRHLLVLAATALALAPSASADVTINYTTNNTPATLTSVNGGVSIYNLGAPGTTYPQPVQIQDALHQVKSLTVADNTVLTINQTIAATTTAMFKSVTDFSVAASQNNFTNAPTIILTGGAQLEYDGFQSNDYFANNTFILESKSMPRDLYAQNGFSGIIDVQQGILQVAGHLNMWTDYGVANPAGFTAHMTGAGAVLVQGSSTISYANTPLNVVNVGPTMGDSILGNPSSPLTYRLNFVHNLYAGSQANFIAGLAGTDVNTNLNTGTDSSYILDIQIDAGIQGSIGGISGVGRIYKTGGGSFTILNSSSQSGDVFLADGNTILADPNGLALRLASSVNLLGGGTGQSDLTYAQSALNSGGTTEWRPAYLPASTGAPTLTISASQTIRNLQALFNEQAINMWNFGTGSGSTISVLPGMSLTVIQDTNLDGYFTGSINGAQGKFIKSGAGNLALMGTSSTIGEIDVVQGSLISNVESLGYGSVVISGGGTLQIVENNAATLRAQISGAVGSVLTVSPSATINNTLSGGAVTVGNSQLGTVDVYNQQTNFYGSLLIENGVTLAFSYGQNNTFINASSLTLNSGLSASSPGVYTSIVFDDTTQTVHNLSGDANTGINLGRGTISLIQSSATNYAGSISGAGNLLLSGGNAITLSGSNTYYGATVVSSGSLTVSGTNGISNSSGLVLLAGASFTATTDQTVGSLFGQAGSTINLAGGSLTIGKTLTQVNQLNTALTSFSGVSPDLYPAYYLQNTPTITTSIVSGLSGSYVLNIASISGIRSGEYISASSLPTVSIVGGSNTSNNVLSLASVANLQVGEAVSAIALTTTMTGGSSGQKVINLTSAANLTVGDAVSGNAIAANSTVLAIHSGTTLTVTSGTVGTPTLTLTTTGLGLTAGQAISGPGIPAGTIITGVGSGSVTLSNNLTTAASTTANNYSTSDAITLNKNLTATALGTLTVATGVSTNSIITSIINGGNYTAISGNSGQQIITTGNTSGLVVGQVITGPGIPAGSVITAISANTSFTISQNLTAAAVTTAGAYVSSPAVQLNNSLTALASGSLAISTGLSSTSIVSSVNPAQVTVNYAPAGQNVVNLNSATGLVVGQGLVGAGVASGAVITAITPGAAITATGGAAGQNVITTASTVGLTIGQQVFGPGIPAGTVITAIATNVNFTLSNPLTTAASTVSGIYVSSDAVTLSQPLVVASSGTLSVAYTPVGGVAGQNVLSLTSISGIQVGQILSGTGIASGSLVTALTAGATYTATGGNLGQSTITTANTSGLVVGQVITGPGIPAGSVITAIVANASFTISQNLTSAASTAANVYISSPAVSLSSGLVSAVSGSISVAPSVTLNQALTGLPNGDLSIVPVSGQSMANTLGFLRGVLNEPASALTPTPDSQILSYRGVITGTGGINITGSETVTLTGINTYTGLTHISSGTLQIEWNSILNTAGIQVDVAGTLVVDVPTGVTGTFTPPISGTGTFDKVGAGTLVINSANGWVAGPVNILGGTLEFDSGGLQNVTGGVVTVASGAFFNINVATNVSWAGSILGAGTITKTGVGALTITGPLAFSGTLDVQQGAVLASSLPNAGGGVYGTVIVETGTTFTDTVAVGTTETFGGAITGAGNFIKAGTGSLNLTTAQNMSGNFTVSAGTVSLGTNNVLANVAAVTLAPNAILSVGSTTQSLSNVSGDVTSQIQATAGANLTFTTSAATTLTYSGQITGSPSITTSGTGTLNLLRDVGTGPYTANVIGTINVLSGTLIGDIDGFGGAALSVATGAKIGFNNSTTTPISYTGSIGGNGIIVKTGTGVIDLSNGTNQASSYEVDGGTLIDTDNRLGAGLALASATIASGATLQLNLGSNATARTLGSQITGVSSSSAGTLDLESVGGGATRTVTLTAIPSLASITIGDNVALSTSMSAIVGVTGTANSSLNFGAGGNITVNQSIDTTFLGNVVSTGTLGLTFVGPGRASFLNTAFSSQMAANNGSSLTVGTGITPGNLEVLQTYNGSTINIVNGTLAVRVNAGTLLSPTVFTAPITGAANSGLFIMTGTGVLNATGLNSSVASAVFTGYQINGGTFIVTPVNGQILAGRTIALNGGALSIQQDVNTASLAGAALSGLISSTPTMVNGVVGAGALVINSGLASPLVLQNNANVQLGTELAPNIAVGGNITVDATSYLHGTGVIAGNLVNAGTLAPGYSPGVMQVNGNFVNSGSMQMEISATALNGTYNDKVAFTGTADLNNGGTGSMTLLQYGASTPALAQRYVLFQNNASSPAATVAGNFVSVLSANQITTSGANPLRYLLAIPVDGPNGTITSTVAGMPVVANEIAAYIVRAPNQYSAFRGSGGLIAQVKAITEVDLNFVNSGADGIVGTSDDVYRATPASTFTALGANLALKSDANLQAALDNLTPYAGAQAAIASIGIFRSDMGYLEQRLETRRFDRLGTSIAPSEWFVDATGSSLSATTPAMLQSSVNVYGLLGGYATDLGESATHGFTLETQHITGSTSSTTARTSGNVYSANYFFGTTLFSDRVAFDVGAGLSSFSGSATRASVVSPSTSLVSSPSALTVGAWARLGTVYGSKSSGNYITPFIGAEYSTTHLSGLNETGASDALSIASSSVSQTAFRAGFGLHHLWGEEDGGWRYRLASDFGYLSQGSGSSATFTSTGNANSFPIGYSSSLNVLPGSGFYVSPSFNFGPNENSTYSIGLTYQQGNGNATSLNFSYRQRF